MWLESILSLLALLLALAARPWRLLRNRTPLAHENHGAPASLWTPLFATLMLLPWLWALPTMQRLPAPLQWSGACLVLLMLGWPLAVPALLVVGLFAALLAPEFVWTQAVQLAFWQGIVPASLAVPLGALVRHLCGAHALIGVRLFVYVLGRGFLGTVLCVFGASVLAQWSGHAEGHPLLVRWLLAWGDAVITGMLCAVFVAFKPEWLATWSDRIYLE